MAEAGDKQWYVLHTYSGYENKVKENLESRAQSMGMEDYIFRAVVPEEEETETKNGKQKTEMKKTFPGYVLVEMVMSDESWFVVRNTPGVTGFVGSHGSGSKPAPLLPEEIDHILDDLGISVEAGNDFEVGESVTIIEGAFSKMTGKVTEIDADHDKLKVDVDMFGRMTSTEVDFSDVQK
ncbi:transcription termination/antitermination protein NusG [Companilactobacillus allii]|uniref:Transcription termination/antitermination protein NusG n=1 Tax=Companilactobacillus allii TaxID=1847728 RepID=A0A1P8PZU8_9LACO|nr:transcription termination/antitermination protein NusG [Companilactobacillus allii]APX71097.1 transcription termination/antitermination protein NusG [Companilactobacillus allii]USQ68175.1 transcription termination/antitermination protein NusG [Companilactobacillus allii]